MESRYIVHLFKCNHCSLPCPLPAVSHTSLHRFLCHITKFQVLHYFSYYVVQSFKQICYEVGDPPIGNPYTTYISLLNVFVLMSLMLSSSDFDLLHTESALTVLNKQQFPCNMSMLLTVEASILSLLYSHCSHSSPELSLCSELLCSPLLFIW